MNWWSGPLGRSFVSSALKNRHGRNLRRTSKQMQIACKNGAAAVAAADALATADVDADGTGAGADAANRILYYATGAAAAIAAATAAVAAPAA